MNDVASAILGKIREREFGDLLERQTWRMSDYGVSNIVSEATMIQMTLSIPEEHLFDSIHSGDITSEQAIAIIEYQEYLRKKLINDLIDDMKTLHILKEE